jgi:hypothetical protein
LGAATVGGLIGALGALAAGAFAPALALTAASLPALDLVFAGLLGSDAFDSCGALDAPLEPLEDADPSEDPDPSEDFADAFGEGLVSGFFAALAGDFDGAFAGDFSASTVFDIG